MFPKEVDTWLRSRLHQIATYVEHLAGSRLSTARHLAAMGIGESTELAHLYVHYGPDSVMGCYELNQAADIAECTKYAHKELGVPDHYVALTGIEGDGILLYNKNDGSILDVEYGQFEQLAAGKVLPLASSVVGYLRWCMQRAVPPNNSLERTRER
jgi:hypothetical protein